MKKVSKKNQQPLISVVVPVYNVEEYLDRCINSIVNQSYNNLEIILVDDGSPDNCPKMCDDWAEKDKRIKVIHKRNGGLSESRNVGISNAKGEYITFVDSDDWIDCKMINILYGMLIKYNADLISCKLLKTSGSEKKFNFNKFSNRIIKYTQEEFLKKFFRIESNEVIHYACGKLYKTNLLTFDQFPIGLTAEDVVGTYKALLKSNIILEVDFPYYFYFKNQNSITRTCFNDRDLDLIKIWNIVVDITYKQNKKYISWAEFNRNRVDYTLLMRMAKDLDYKTIRDKYDLVCKNMLIRLKKNKSELLKSNLSFFRKVSIRLICFNYTFFVSICSIIRRLI